MSATQEVLAVKELAYRKRDSLEVTLWWVKGTMDTYVSVIDHSQEPPFHYNVDTPPGASPNDIFNHPFRYINDEPTVGVTDGRGTE